MKQTPQAKCNRKRRAEGHAIGIVLKEPDAIGKWLALSKQYGGPKPALLALLRGRDT